MKHFNMQTDHHRTIGNHFSWRTITPVVRWLTNHLKIMACDDEISFLMFRSILNKIFMENHQNQHIHLDLPWADWSIAQCFTAHQHKMWHSARGENRLRRIRMTNERQKMHTRYMIDNNINMQWPTTSISHWLNERKNNKGNTKKLQDTEWVEICNSRNNFITFQFSEEQQMHQQETIDMSPRFYYITLLLLMCPSTCNSSTSKRSTSK
jgi:hypothetical protein